MAADDATVARLVQLCRAMGYGHLVVEVVAGEPRVVRIIPCVRLDRPMEEGLADLLTQLALAAAATN